MIKTDSNEIYKPQKFKTMNTNRLVQNISQRCAMLRPHILFFGSFIWACLAPSPTFGQCTPTCTGTNTYLGTNAGSANTGIGNTFVGHAAGPDNTTGQRNSFFGQTSGSKNTTGSFNSFFGEDAGLSNTFGEKNSFFGQDAGQANTTGSFNSFFGEDAGLSNTIANFNSFFGKDAGKSNSHGEYNSFFGRGAGTSSTSGFWNSFFGEGSGFSNTHGDGNSFFGIGSGYRNTTGDYNSFFGSASGLLNTTGHRNSSLGNRAGSAIRTGSDNICLGSNSGPTNDSSHVSNRLYIDVGITNDPLIFAEFDNDLVRINGTFEVTGGLSNPSSILLKDQFRSVEAASILDKVSQLSIKEWSYKQQSGVRHIGPIAEEFYETFGLGSDSTKISTIDTDGVALLSIQALHKQLQSVEEENKETRKENDEIRKENLALQEAIKTIMLRLEHIEHSAGSG